MCRFALLLSLLFISQNLLGQTSGTKTMRYFDAQNKALQSASGAAYAIETKFIDSLNAIERVYFSPKKIREEAAFSNIRRRLRHGETVVYYDDGSIKRRENYWHGFRQGDGVIYYPNGKIRSRDRWEGYNQVFQECFDTTGNNINCDTLARHTSCLNKLESVSKGANIYYPAKALKLDIEGVVKVKFVISRTGELVDAWIIESPSPLLSIEALAAVRRAKWGIFLVDCDPVDKALIQPVTFSIK